ncbi:hypothetical protein [Achromobacter insolitus]|uniref:hypothetical protein n=1 Tax=Achromobacter insolitus TaxID=217204 RepID=UPI0013F4F3C3|nr:hypothetical protein [Achromobacter insolitus]
MENNKDPKQVTRAHLFARIEAFQLIPQPEPTEAEQNPEGTSGDSNLRKEEE